MVHIFLSIPFAKSDALSALVYPNLQFTISLPVLVHLPIHSALQGAPHNSPQARNNTVSCLCACICMCGCVFAGFDNGKTVIYSLCVVNTAQFPG